MYQEVNLPPLEPKTESYLSPISPNWFIRRMVQMYNSGIYFTFSVAMATKMADEIGLKYRNCHFEPNLRVFQTDFLRIRYQQKRIPKNLLIYCVP